MMNLLNFDVTGDIAKIASNKNVGLQRLEWIISYMQYMAQTTQSCSCEQSIKASLKKKIINRICVCVILDDTEEYAVRLINSQNPGRNAMEGRLEIYFAGVWGSVCDDGFTNITAKVVCASLGYG